jgi:hypothetical protein
MFLQALWLVEFGAKSNDATQRKVVGKYCQRGANAATQIARIYITTFVSTSSIE